MGRSSKIEWTDATWNPWQGCTKVSPACANCYMFSDMRRYGKDPTVVRRSKDPTFFLPLKKLRTGEHAIPSGFKVFTCSWSDWFHERADAWRPKAFSVIQQRPDVIFQILTKRPERIEECLPPDWGEGYPNVWLGTTVEDQQRADERIPWLLKVPAAVRFLSCEPLLGPIDLWPLFKNSRICEHCGKMGRDGLACEHCDRTGFAYWPIQQVIAGGESGHNARPTHPAWVRSLRNQCSHAGQGAGVPFFFKQWGEWVPRHNEAMKTIPILPLMDAGRHGVFDDDEEFRINEGQWSRYENLLGEEMYRVGKKAAGRMIDGREWSEFPEVSVAIV
jgi:protein gp37